MTRKERLAYKLIKYYREIFNEYPTSKTINILLGRTAYNRRTINNLIKKGYVRKTFFNWLVIVK